MKLRSWYVETASPVKKNLVIIIDRSGSMSGLRMRLAKEAAFTVLDTLSPKDNVSIVHFWKQEEFIRLATRLNIRICKAPAYIDKSCPWEKGHPPSRSALGKLTFNIFPYKMWRTVHMSNKKLARLEGWRSPSYLYRLFSIYKLFGSPSRFSSVKRALC